ncbi:uncharacterized protein LOC110250339 [Exaiptasia diaphana]|uniref:Uncharacterized protein n=1 Tax=Exaiptasia diaphana TaxID=2652724 RepID=A0A913Y1G8_EXADI|nr:uncharacterized protein LOC110250339 [Exaiptasia diaphana]XP_020912599.1 uncharacterized protein LOC110250339 [Exaiptasia diaphana]XP_028518361.1 uncharacterized protein LOC110250339 [Exaiptasia diaphana]KXJ07592.1 Protein FAM111A [Exaiptasia diaphana]
MNRKITDFFKNDSGYQSNEVSPCCDSSILKKSSTPQLSNNTSTKKRLYSDRENSDVELEDCSLIEKCPDVHVHDEGEIEEHESIESEADDDSEQSDESDSDDDSYEHQFVSKNHHNKHHDDEDDSEHDTESEAADEREFIGQSDDDDGQFVSKNCHDKSEHCDERADEYCDISEFSCNTNKENELADNNRLQQKKLQIKVHGLGTNARMFQTNGQETILHMVKKYLKMYNLMKSTSVLIFKDKHTGSALNLGLPTGTLDKNVEYQCIFKEKLEYNTEQLIRAFKVELYNDEWPLKSFQLKFDSDRNSKPNVCRMSKVTDLIDVPFMVGETLYEALCRDGRFDVEDNNGQLNICKCELEDVGSAVRVPLDNDASDYGGKTFELYFSKAFTNGKVEPLPYPPCMHEIIPNVTSQLDPSSNVQSAVTPAAEPSSEQGAPVHDFSEQEIQSLSIDGSQSAKKLIAHTVHEFKTFIENDFKIKVEKEGLSKNEKKRLGKVKKFVKAGYDKFALNRNFELSCSHLRKLLQLCESTGAIVLQLYSGERQFIGTCFRVGHKYVITNYHVYKIIEDKKDQGMLKSVYIDFSYKGNNEISACSSTDYKIITYSVELDYAIIEVKKPKHRELPISVTSSFTIPCLVKSPEQGMFLTFSGHPNGSRETMTNLFCPLKSLESLDERVVMGLSKNEHEALIDPKRQFYDISTFFYGSSGSPGVLLQDGFLLVLHCGQYPLNDGLGGAIEQGVLMAAIVADVKSRHVDLVEDIFDLPKDMEVDSED